MIMFGVKTEEELHHPVDDAGAGGAAPSPPRAGAGLITLRWV